MTTNALYYGDNLDILRRYGRMTMTFAKGATEPPTGDLIDQLRRLAELRDAGIITVDDFEAKKADLLARM